MKKPKITFVMMAYNAQNLIGKAIDSVLNQTEPNVCLVVRNNGSTDKTGEICREYAKKDDRVFVIENKVNGVPDDDTPYQSLGWWLPDGAPVGEYISFLDADDYLAPDFSSSLLKVAERSGAQMAVGGCYFMQGSTEELTGTRVPPALETDDMTEISPVFPELYGSLRTWWGKLYQSDFFIEHFTYAWEMTPPFYFIVDTGMVLRYLKKTTAIACVPEPLYYFRVSDSSTYTNRFMYYSRIWEADMLFRRGMEALMEFSAVTKRNVEALYSIHLGYLTEALECMTRNPRQTLESKMPSLEDVLNDQILAHYQHERFEAIFFFIRRIITHVMEQKNDYPALWEHYLTRLHYTVVQREKGDSSVLDFPVLLSALCDPKNKGQFGRELLRKEYLHISKGEALFANLPDIQQEHFLNHPDEMLEEILATDRTEEVREKEACLREFWEERQYGDVLTYIKEISNVCPLSRDAMYYRIYAAFVMQERAFSMQMAAAAKILYANDDEMQELCRVVIQEYKKEREE